MDPKLYEDARHNALSIPLNWIFSRTSIGNMSGLENSLSDTAGAWPAKTLSLQIAKQNDQIYPLSAATLSSPCLNVNSGWLKHELDPLRFFKENEKRYYLLNIFEKLTLILAVGLGA